MLAAAFKNFVRKSTRASKPNAVAGSRQAAFSTERTYEDAPPLLIRNGTVVNHDAIFKADVLTQEGKIIKVGQISEEEVPKNAKEVDATGRYVIPGGIDTHTHMENAFYGYNNYRRLPLWDNCSGSRWYNLPDRLCCSWAWPVSYRGSPRLGTKSNSKD